MKLKIKKLSPNAVVPSYAHHGDAGMDLTAASIEIDAMGNVVYGTGIAVEIPEGYVGLIFPRSSICKTDLALSNAVGVVDSGFRGEVMAKFKPTLRAEPRKEHGDIISHSKCPPLFYRIGDRIAQMIILPYPHVEFEEVESLSDTERGTGGYGSTGK